MTNDNHERAREEYQRLLHLIYSVFAPYFRPVILFFWLFIGPIFNFLWPIVRYQFEFRWTIVKNVFKVSIVIASFLGFCLAIRQYELQRFNEVKGIFEVSLVTETVYKDNGEDIEHFCDNDNPCIVIHNHGSPVCFVGCSSGEDKNATNTNKNNNNENMFGAFAASLTYPDKHTFVYSKSPLYFYTGKNIYKNIYENYSKPHGEYFPLICWFRDADLNWYETSIVPRLYTNSTSEGVDFYFNDVPKAYRTEKLFHAVPNEKLYWLFSLVVRQEWFEDSDPRPGWESCREKQQSERPNEDLSSGYFGEHCLLPSDMNVMKPP